VNFYRRLVLKTGDGSPPSPCVWWFVSFSGGLLLWFHLKTGFLIWFGCYSVEVDLGFVPGFVSIQDLVLRLLQSWFVWLERAVYACCVMS
jgi:hypothetical protein